MDKNMYTLRNAKERYPMVFSPLTIKGVSIPNRIVFPPWVVNYATQGKGTISDELTSFYTRLARGGAGLIYVGAAGISGDIPPGYEGVIRIDGDEFIPGLRKLFHDMKDYGCCVALQLAHMGRQAAGPAPGVDALIAPSNVPDPVIAQKSPFYKLREMNDEDIDRVRGEFVEAAFRGVVAGAQVIEFHAAHGYLLHNFLSNRTNRRKDAYGGSLENRTRLLREIIEQTRKKVGDGAILSVRVSITDFLEGGLEPEDYATITPILEKAGMDLINVSVGTQTETLDRCMPGKKLGEAPNVDVIARMRNYTTLPMITVGAIGSLATAESILSQKKADLVAIGRSQVADQDFVRKSAKGLEEEIRKCIRCNRCCFWTVGEDRMHCAVNPDYKKASKKRT